MAGSTHGQTIDLCASIQLRADQLTVDVRRYIDRNHPDLESLCARFRQINREAANQHPGIDGVTAAYGIDAILDLFAELHPDI